MIFLIGSLLANIGIFIVFKLIPYFKLNALPVIVVNYFVCVLTGALFIGNLTWVSTLNPFDPFFYIAAILGVVFIFAFYLMARTTEQLGMTVASVASKISLVIPIFINLFIFKTAYKSFDAINYIGLILAVPAILLSTIKPSKGGQKSLKVMFFLPVMVFLTGGTIDTTINYANIHYIPSELAAVFPIIIFAFAATTGAVFSFFTKIKFNTKSVLLGSCLGTINYFSMFCLVKALEAFNNDGSTVYSILNIGIILGAALLSYFIFKEKLTRLNWLGVLIAVLSVLSIFYQEILAL